MLESTQDSAQSYDNGFKINNQHSSLLRNAINMEKYLLAKNRSGCLCGENLLTYEKLLISIHYRTMCLIPSSRTKTYTMYTLTL